MRSLFDIIIHTVNTRIYGDFITTGSMLPDLILGEGAIRLCSVPVNSAGIHMKIGQLSRLSSTNLRQAGSTFARQSPRPISITNGTYMMHLNSRTVMPKENPVNDNKTDNPPVSDGIQKIEKGTTIVRPNGSHHDVNSDYGYYRIKLNPTDESRDQGLYLHGKDAWYNSRTHGCVCEKDEYVLKYIWEHKEIKGNVPFVISDKK